MHEGDQEIDDIIKNFGDNLIKEMISDSYRIIFIYKHIKNEAIRRASISNYIFSLKVVTIMLTYIPQSVGLISFSRLLRMKDSEDKPLII